MNYLIHKRTFEAKRCLIGSKARLELNKSSITSEYMPSHKWTLTTLDDNRQVIGQITFRTKKEASRFFLDKIK